MAGPAPAYAYRYPHASAPENTSGGAKLRLATSSGRGVRPSSYLLFTARITLGCLCKS